jgi:hypothetical protein
LSLLGSGRGVREGSNDRCGRGDLYDGSSSSRWNGRAFWILMNPLQSPQHAAEPPARALMR